MESEATALLSEELTTTFHAAEPNMWISAIR